MNWQIKTIADRSSLSEIAFNSGDKVVCLIFKDKVSGDFGRVDLFDHEVEGFDFPGEILGCWSRLIKDLAEEKINAGDRLAFAEDFFMSLYQDERNSNQKETNALKHLLALMLERKRVLRSIRSSRMTEKTQHYLHVKQKKAFEVPVVEISSDLFLKIQGILGDIIL